MRNQTQQDIQINKEVIIKGIGPSSVLGIKQVQNMDIFNIDGVARANFELFSTFPPSVTTTFTANAGTDILTVASSFKWTLFTSTQNATTRAVTVSSTGSLPTGLNASTPYFIIEVTATTIKLATTFANANAGIAIDITTNGAGTLTIASINPGRFNHIDSLKATGAQDVFAQDSNARVWRYDAAYGWVLIPGNTLTSGAGEGLKVWKNYVFAFRSGAVDLYGPLTGVPAWTNSWGGGTGLNGNLSRTDHTCFISQNGRLYFANRSAGSIIPYIGSLQESVGSTFDPASGVTYTWNSTALDLPDHEFVTDIEELNGKLQIATTSNKIYPWDKISDSFDSPVITSEPNVQCLRVLNNALYYGCGFRGNIYRTYGTTSEIVVDFSDDLSNYPQTTAQCLDLEIYQGNILAAISGATPGIYMVDINNGNRYSLFNTFSTSTALPIMLFTDFNYSGGYAPFQYFASWNAEGGVIGCDANVFKGYGPYRATSDKPFIVTELIRIGDDSNNPRTLETVELFLRKAITSGQSVKIQLRYDDNSAFDTAREFTFTSMADARNLAGWAQANLEKSRWIQMKIIISIPSPADGVFTQYNTPEIAEVRVV